MYLPYYCFLVGIVAPRSFGRIKTGSRRPDEEPFVVGLRTVATKSGGHRFPPVGTGEKCLLVTLREERPGPELRERERERERLRRPEPLLRRVQVEP
ncbi:MAG: hypothetical protein WCF18_05460, partial [Chthoniobacteraceae bacterium]